MKAEKNYYCMHLLHVCMRETNQRMRAPYTFLSRRAPRFSSLFILINIQRCKRMRVLERKPQTNARCFFCPCSIIGRESSRTRDVYYTKAPFMLLT